MRFGREIDDGKKLMLERERIHRIGIGDVGFEKLVALAMFLDHAVEVGEISRVGEDVDVGDGGGLVMLQNVANKIAPDEAAAASHENSHSKS